MKIILFIFLVFIVVVKLNAQIKVTLFSPSAFYTYSNYSDGGTANSVSGFTTVGLNYNIFLTAGYDRLLINHPASSPQSYNGWKYDQQMLSLGGTKNIYPFYLGIFYSRITGKYNSKPAGFDYTDYLNVFDVNLLYNSNLYFFGLSGNYITLDGFFNLNIKHYSAVVKRLFGANILFSAAFIQSIISDGRNLSSVKIDLNYKISNSFSVHGSSAFGERAYFYDDQILTIFNQNETQKLDLSLGAKYFITLNFSFIINYSFTEFASSLQSEAYNVSYFAAGISYRLD